MIQKLICLLAPMIIFGCSSDKTISYNSEKLKIERIKKDVFKHITYLKTEDFGNVACNGLIYFNGDEAIVFDTPTENSASAELINWIQKTQKKKITAVVVTHFHNDCLGGLEEFHKNNIVSYANNSTIELAFVNNEITPLNGFDDLLELNVGNSYVISRYFGQGHTKDNIVGYIPEENTLFGGCLIKEVNAGKGYLGDANIEEWSETVGRIKQAYPDVEIVVPGHGTHGGVELLDYTIGLFKN
jgi:metallo-beta-lactamase class B